MPGLAPAPLSISMKHIDKLRDTHVLILGGSSGLGFGVAEAAIEHNAHVTISSSQPSKIADAISRLRAAYPETNVDITGHACDLSSPESLESNLKALFETTITVRKIDHIVITAGDAIPIKPLTETSVTEILAAGTVRFLSPLVIGKLAPHYMNPGPISSITLTGGTMSHRPLKHWTVQAAWGSGVEGVARGLATDLAPIRVNIVNPGAVYTEIFQGIPKEALQTVMQVYRDWTLLDKVGTPDEAAESYIYCMKSTFVTGTVLDADGGRAVK